jgi:hypothetical protein
MRSRSLSARHRPCPLGWLLLVPAGVGIYMAYTFLAFHQAFLFMTAERHWHRVLSLPTTAMLRGAKAVERSVLTIAGRPDVFLHPARLPFRYQWLALGNLTAFLALFAVVALLVVCWRRLLPACSVLAFASLLLPLCYPARGTPLLSLPRFAFVEFPLFIALALALDRHRVARGVVVVAMVAGLVLLTATFANDMWVA